MILLISSNELCAKSVHVFTWPFSYESDGSYKGFEGFGKKLEHAGWVKNNFEKEIKMPDRKDDINKFRCEYMLRQSLSKEAENLYFSKNPACHVYNYGRIFADSNGKKEPSLFYLKTPEKKEYYLPIAGIELYAYSFGLGILSMEVIFPDEKEYNLHTDDALLFSLPEKATRYTSDMIEEDADKIISDIEKYGAVTRISEIPSGSFSTDSPLAVGIIDALSHEEYITSFEDDIENINSLSKDFDGHAFNMKNMRDIAVDLNNEASFFKDIILFGKLNSKEWEEKLFEKKNHIKDEKITSLSERRLYSMSLVFSSEPEKKISSKRSSKADEEPDNEAYSIFDKTILRKNVTKRDLIDIAEFLTVDGNLFIISLSEYYGIKALSDNALETVNTNESELLSDVEKDSLSNDLRRNFINFRDKAYIKNPSLGINENSFFEGLFTYFGIESSYNDFITRFSDLTVTHSKSKDSLFTDLFIVFASIAIIAIIAGGTGPVGAKTFFIVVVIILSFFIKEITALLSRLKKFLREHVHIDFKK